jgi:xanthine/uracil/vitamin C permease (AzgA family)
MGSYVGIRWDERRVFGVSGSLNMSVESVVFVSGVVYCTGGAIGLHQLVVAFDFIAVTFLSLLLEVVSVWICHSILELIFRVGL